MPRYLLVVNYEGGAIETPMLEWDPADIAAHMDYYAALSEELHANGEVVDQQRLTGPDVATVVTWDGAGEPLLTDGPFPEFKEWLAGYQIVDVDSRERALEIAAKLSAVPGPGGVATQQPIQVRQVMDDSAEEQ